MKISSEEYKEHIRELYIDACIQYRAMELYAQKYGVDDIPTPTPSPEPEPTPTPTPSPEPTPEPSGEPEFVYSGPASYSIKRGEHCYFTILVKNATQNDFKCTVPGDPGYIKADDKWSKTDNGYKIDVDVKGINPGGGQYCLYWAKDGKDRDKWLTITIKVTG